MAAALLRQISVVIETQFSLRMPNVALLFTAVGDASAFRAAKKVYIPGLLIMV